MTEHINKYLEERKRYEERRTLIPDVFLNSYWAHGNGVDDSTILENRKKFCQDMKLTKYISYSKNKRTYNKCEKVRGVLKCFVELDHVEFYETGINSNLVIMINSPYQTGINRDELFIKYGFIPTYPLYNTGADTYYKFIII